MKKIISILLAIVMAATMLPLSGIAAMALTQTQWTVAASSDFTQATWTCTNTNKGSTGYTVATDGYVPATSNGGTQMTWSGYEWNNKYRDSTVYGANIENGLMWISGSQTGEVPIKGAQSFKIDIAFRFTGDFTWNSRGKDTDTPVFIKISTNSNGKFGYVSEKPWENEFYTQEAYGRAHFMGSGADVGENAEGGKYRITTNNYAKNTQNAYHYVLTYEAGYILAQIKDSNGNTIQRLASSYSEGADTNAITGIYIGSCKTNYYQNLAIQNITMYTGATQTTGTKSFIPAAKDKYVLTYFTGNHTAGETLHMAVSDDGLNWEALYGNNPIWDSTHLTGNEVSYPDNSGIAASGHVRDPYAFQAQDGSYYVLATDLNTENGSNWSGNSKMMVWHLDSLADLGTTNPWFIDTQSFMGSVCQDGNVSRAWAPEAIWDADAGHYMLYWAVGYDTSDKNNNTHMYYRYTDDFKTFLTEPEELYVTGKSNIDGDIYYDGIKYYMVYKDETNKKIAFAHAARPCGPYSPFREFSDNNLSSLEGCEVYQLQSGDYILMVDNYSNSDPFFANYRTSTTPDSFTSEMKVTNNRLNHLSPRHGSVINITTEEYVRLVSTYGKSTFDTTGVPTNKNVNDDYLVARYFTTDNPEYDATGHGHTLTNSGVTMTSNYGGRVAAHFTGNATDITTNNNNNTNGSGNKVGTYASVNTADMFSGFDLKDGVTFSWYGFAENCSSGRWFDWSTANPGTVVWDGTPTNQTNTRYAYAASNMEFGADNLGEMAIAEGYKGTTYKNGWHEYTMSISHGYINFWVDGALLYTQYGLNGVMQKQGTPIALPSMNADFFNAMINNGKLYFGISSYAADAMLNGYISDFRVYKRALSEKDIVNSHADLDAYLPKENLDPTKCVYYDPMEDMDITGNHVNDKTAYAQTVDDDLHQKVLNINGGVDSHYAYNGNSTVANNGYTISMYYNPGADVTQETIFQIGKKNTVNDANRRYFELQEDGHLWFNYEDTSTGLPSNEDESFFDATGVLGNKLKANTWSHIVIQVQANGYSDIIYVYVDGLLTSKFAVYGSSFAHRTIDDHAAHEFLGKQHNVYYGSSCGHWTGATQNCYLDDFRIYSGLIDAQQIFAADSYSVANTLINQAVEDYADKMAELKNKDYVYTNMAPAYNAYDRAMRYLDSINYGANTMDAAYVLTLYKNLVNATNAMQVYQKPATKQGLTKNEVNVAHGVSEDYTHNMLSTVDLSALTEMTGGTKEYNFSVALSSTSFTWLYTGIEDDNPTAPLNVAVRKTNQSFGSTQRLEGFHFKDDTSNPTTQNGITIPTKIRMTNSNGSVQDWVYENLDGSYNSASWVANHHVNAQQNSDGYFEFTTNNTWLKGSCFLEFTGTLSDNQNAEYYYETREPSFAADNSWKVAGSGTRVDFTFPSTGTILIVNYSPVYNKIMKSATLNNYLANIVKYTPSSTKDLLAAYDRLTGLDYSVNGVDAAKTLSANIKKEVLYLLGVDLSLIENKVDPTILTNEKTAQEKFFTEATKTTDDNGSVTVGTLVDGVFTPTLDEKGNEQKYTTSSWDSYEHAYERLTEYFTELDPYGVDNQYATSVADVTQIKNNVQKAKTALQVAADYSAVDDAINDPFIANDKLKGNYNIDAQIYTYDTYIDFARAYDPADYWYQKDAAYRADTEKYRVDYIQATQSTLSKSPYVAIDSTGAIVTTASQANDIDHYKFVGEFYSYDEDTNTYKKAQFEDGTYVKVGENSYVDAGMYRYSTNLDNNSQLSNRQTQINAKGDDLTDAYGALKGVDDESAYTAYENTLAVVDAIDTAKYTPAGIAHLASAVDSANGVVYKTLSAAEATEYNNATGKSFAEGDRIKNTTRTKTDPQTSSILTAINEINDEDSKATYINKFHATLDVQIEGVSQGTVSIPDKYYGETFTLNGASRVTGLDVKPTSWSVSILDSDNATVKSSQKVSSYIGDTMTRIADTNIAVTVNYDYKTNTKTDMYMYEVYNVYNKLESVHYNATLFTDANVGTGLGITAKKIPFYSFSKWTTTVDENKKVVKVRPTYDLTQTYTITSADTVKGFTVDNEDGTYVAKYDTYVTVSTEDEDFQAWAVRSGSTGKYSIASYNKEYTFLVACDEEYVQVKKNGTTYKINDAVVTSSNVNCELANDVTGNVSINGYINQKLTNKAPFTSIEAVTMTATQARAYVRITTGCEVPVAAYGIIYTPSAATASTMVKNGAGVYTRNINNANASGQYCFTLNSKTSFATTSISFRSYVNYDFTYKFDHTTGTEADDNQAEINALEYSSVMVANRA